MKRTAAAYFFMPALPDDHSLINLAVAHANLSSLYLWIATQCPTRSRIQGAAVAMQSAHAAAAQILTEMGNR
jgi:hypothetical protein